MKILQSLTGLAPELIQDVIQSFEGFELDIDDAIEGYLNDLPNDYPKLNWSEQTWFTFFERVLYDALYKKIYCNYDSNIVEYLTTDNGNPKISTLSVHHKPSGLRFSSLAKLKIFLGELESMVKYFEAKWHLTYNDLKVKTVTVGIDTTKIRWQDTNMASTSIQWNEQQWADYFNQEDEKIDSFALGSFMKQIERHFEAFVGFERFIGSV